MKASRLHPQLKNKGFVPVHSYPVSICYLFSGQICSPQRLELDAPLKEGECSTCQSAWLGGIFTLSSPRCCFSLRTSRFYLPATQGGAGSPAHAAGHTCPVCPGASWGRRSVSPAHQHPTCTYLWQPSPGHCPNASGVTAPPAGSSSFPLYYFVDCLHHSAVEKFKCFVTFH